MTAAVSARLALGVALAAAASACTDMPVERAVYDAIQMQQRPRPGAQPVLAPQRPAGAPLGDYDAYRRERERLLGGDAGRRADAGAPAASAIAPEGPASAGSTGTAH